RISKSGYKEHHGAYIFNGKQDEWNKQFLPYGFELQNGVAIARIPNAEKLFACFAAASLVETADGKLAYGIRTNLVDCYRSMHSLNSGGRFNGSPHKMVEELTEDPALLYDHVSGMLKQEYINLVDTDIAYHRLTGLSRSLDDLDLTLCVLTRVNLPFDKLNEKLNRGKKYDGLKCVPANSDGMTELLESQEKFPSTIFPTIVMAAPSYGVDPRQVLPEIKILD
ncbi:MAG: hypothetical protein Q8R37_01460, partial [Nanoarchaeota archaeon]|nr:hypothetical protein [Nanoarchaeota archaeon]